jgi:hypothetical protein
MIEPLAPPTPMLRRAALEYYVPGGGAGREGPRANLSVFIGNHR